MSEINKVTKWIDAAKQERNNRNLANYIAYTLSEIGEGLRAIDDPDLEELTQLLEDTSVCMRNGYFDFAIEKTDKVELLDCALDTAWTAIGMAHMLGHAREAFNEVSDSNFSKFLDGVAVLDGTGKVVKGPHFFKPQLKPFLK